MCNKFEENNLANKSGAKWVKVKCYGWNEKVEAQSNNLHGLLLCLITNIWDTFNHYQY